MQEWQVINLCRRITEYWARYSPVKGKEVLLKRVWSSLEESNIGYL